MNKKLLEYYMAKNNDSKVELAEALEMSLQTLYRRMQSGSFSCPELKAIRDRYELSDNQFCEIFLVE